MVLIRMAKREDIPEMLKIYRPLVQNAATSFEFQMPGEEEFANRIKGIQQKYPWLVCQCQESIAAYAYAGPHRAREAYQWSTELSVYVSSSFRRRKIATALYKTLMAILVLQGYRNALIGITLPNEASVNFHESLGFTPVGIYQRVGYKLGSWHSVGWWEMPLTSTNDLEAPQKLRTPLEIQNTTGWEEAIKGGLSQIKY